MDLNRPCAKRVATVKGGPFDGEVLEVKAPTLRAAAWPCVALEGTYEDGSPRIGTREWLWRLYGDSYELAAEPIKAR